MVAGHRGKFVAALLAGAAFLFLAAGPTAISAAPSSDPLLQGFRLPPQAAKPRVWWHWMNGNVSKDGIRKDLDWMHRMGIGGANAIDASLATPQVVDKRLIYMTPEWQDAFRYAVGLADKYGLEMSIDSSPGWSETGGPWVTPQEAMKKLVWSATRVSGPFHGVLPQPPGNAGPIQNAPMKVGILDPKPKSADLVFYRDGVVVTVYKCFVFHQRSIEVRAIYFGAGRNHIVGCPLPTRNAHVGPSSREDFTNWIDVSSQLIFEASDSSAG